MRFTAENAEEIVDFLKKESSLGKEYVTYQNDSIIKGKEDIQCFSGEFDALQYAHDNTSAWDVINTATISDALSRIS